MKKREIEKWLAAEEEKAYLAVIRADAEISDEKATEESVKV